MNTTGTAIAPSSHAWRATYVRTYIHTYIHAHNRNSDRAILTCVEHTYIHTYMHTTGSATAPFSHAWRASTYKGRPRLRIIRLSIASFLVHSVPSCHVYQSHAECTIFPRKITTRFVDLPSIEPARKRAVRALHAHPCAGKTGQLMFRECACDCVCIDAWGVPVFKQTMCRRNRSVDVQRVHMCMYRCLRRVCVPYMYPRDIYLHSHTHMHTAQ